ncbi:MAG: GNAT family N-acetyltransferase [Pseudomonadota bacterium]
MPDETIAIGVEPANSPDGEWCLAQYYSELAKRFDEGFDPNLKNKFDPAEMEPPNGWFVVGRIGEKPVACGAVMKLDGSASICEVKRVWVSSNARGSGLGSKIMDKLETLAKEAGFTRVKLDTNRALGEAKGLYEKLGYAETYRYNDNPYADHFFEKAL